MPSSRAPLRLAAVLALALVPLACGDDDPADPDLGDAARLTVLLTDAPGDVAAAWVDFTRIYLQGGDGPVDLLEEPTGLIELTELVGTSMVLVDELELEPGSYGQLRFVVGAAVLESDDGTVYTLGGAEHPDGLEAGGQLQCPSCQQSGLKVILPGDELDLDLGVTTVTLDFDVSESFGHRAGNSGRWIMKPTIHGSWVEGAGMGPEVAGQVTLGEGVGIPECPAGVTRSLEDFVPLAVSATLVDGEGLALVRHGTTSADGSFVLGPLPADTWTLGHLGTLELDGADLVFEASVAPAEVLVEDTGISGVSYVVTAASCVASGG